MLYADQGAVHLDVQVITVLLSHGANINATDEDGQTPLQYALLCDHRQVKSSCCQRNAGVHCGASVQVRVAQGLTAQILLFSREMLVLYISCCAGLQHTSKGWWTIITACMCIISWSVRPPNETHRPCPRCMVIAKEDMTYFLDSSCC